MELITDFFERTAKVLTVAELTRAIRGALETRFGAVWVQGEISNYKQHPSGHQYFTLKDSRAQIACVIFRNAPLSIRQPLADGAQVQVYGDVSVFEARGQYQLSVQIIQPRGLGVLQAKFDALKRKLDAERLFDRAHKKPLPKFPKRIGIVTSPSGAAIRDMLNVLQRRAPNLQIIINPVRVQGTGAAQEIAVAIRELATPNESLPPLDLIVITRGALLANAIAALRARNPERELSSRRESLQQLQRRLRAEPLRLIESARQRFVRVQGMLRILGPEATLERGYTITMDERGEIVR